MDKNLSNFNPTLRIVEPADEPDRFTEGVLHSLGRPAHSSLSSSIARSFLYTALTLGIVPMIAMIRQLRKLIDFHQQQFWHLAEWMRLHASHSADVDAIELQKASEKIRFNTPLGFLTWLFVLIAVGAIAMHFTVQPFQVRELFRFAYRIPRAPDAMIFDIALCAAAICNLAHLAWHQQNIARYIRWFNQILRRQNLHEVQLPRLGVGPLWLVGGISLAACGGLWALPVMLACGTHRRYTRFSSLQVRSEIVQRLRSLLFERRPAIRHVPGYAFARACIRPNCRATMPAIANFCPRCGTKVARAMDVVA
jgi:hypothetical protein